LLYARGLGAATAAGDRAIALDGMSLIDFANDPGLAMVVVQRNDYSRPQLIDGKSVRRNFAVNDVGTGASQWVSFVDALAELDSSVHIVILATKGPINAFINDSVSNGPTAAQYLQSLGASRAVAGLGPNDAFVLIGAPGLGTGRGKEMIVDSAGSGSPPAELAAILLDDQFLDARSHDSGPPAGAIVAFGGSNVPAGWLRCEGTAVGRAVYPALFAAIGTTWGAGDGSTTFNLPDLRGRATIGSGTYVDTVAGSLTRNLGQTLGAAQHMLTINEMPSHSHDYNDFYWHDSGNVAEYSTPTGDDVGQRVSDNRVTANAGGNQAHNNMPPSAVVTYIIRY
jgi:microcystin-dependent protein